MDQGWLRAKAREAIQSGKLPGRQADRSWAGPGSGGDCTVCGKALAHDESELELDFGAGVLHPSPLTLRMHVRCFDAWELELAHGSSDRAASEEIPGGDGLAPAQNGRRPGSIEEDSLPPAENAGTMTHREHKCTNERENQ